MQKSEYGVSIESADNGIIVRVGCKTLVVLEENIGIALADIKLLLFGGWEAQRELRKKYLGESEEKLNGCVTNAGIEAAPQPIGYALNGR